MNDQDRRAEYTRGLRALADLLDAHPELETPYTSELLVIPTEQREQIAAWARALPGKRRKEVRDGYFDLYGSLHGITIRVIVYRDEVCRKVVTGTHEVTEQVPDPDALAQVPTIAVTKTVEDVEWVCEPILDAEQVAS